MVGRLIRKGAHARLILSVDLIGQGVSVEVDAADVKPVLSSSLVARALPSDGPLAVKRHASYTDSVSQSPVPIPNPCRLGVRP